MDNTNRNLSDVDRLVLEFIRNDIKKGLYKDMNAGHGYYFNEVKEKYEEYSKLFLTKPIKLNNFDIEYPLTLEKIQKSNLDSKSKSKLKFAFLSNQKYQEIDENRNETFKKLDFVFVEIESFGWKNCDAKLGNLLKDENVQSVKFRLNPNEHILNVVIFAEQDRVLYHFHEPQKGDITLTPLFLERMRKNQNFRFVFFVYGGKESVYFDEKEFFIKNELDYKVNLKKISSDDFKQKISEMNR